MRKGFSIFLFLLAGITIFAGVGNLVIRYFYNYKPEAWFVIVILAISGSVYLGMAFTYGVNKRTFHLNH